MAEACGLMIVIQVIQVACPSQTNVFRAACRTRAWYMFVVTLTAVLEAAGYLARLRMTVAPGYGPCKPVCGA